jgi:hypothetical protein
MAPQSLTSERTANTRPQRHQVLLPACTRSTEKSERNYCKCVTICSANEMFWDKCRQTKGRKVAKRNSVNCETHEDSITNCHHRTSRQAMPLNTVPFKFITSVAESNIVFVAGGERTSLRRGRQPAAGEVAPGGGRVRQDPGPRSLGR